MNKLVFFFFAIIIISCTDKQKTKKDQNFLYDSRGEVVGFAFDLGKIGRIRTTFYPDGLVYRNTIKYNGNEEYHYYYSQNGNLIGMQIWQSGKFVKSIEYFEAQPKYIEDKKNGEEIIFNKNGDTIDIYRPEFFK